MAGQASCYNPSHALTTKDYTPCFSGTNDGYTLCCQAGWTCLDNLLCVNLAASPQGTLARGACTDKSFGSKNCPQFCLNGDENIKNCGDGTGCCKVNGDCTCGVGQPGALLFDINGVRPYTALPTAPITVYKSGIAVSVMTPAPKPTSAISVSSRPPVSTSNPISSVVATASTLLAAATSLPGSTSAPSSTSSGQLLFNPSSSLSSTGAAAAATSSSSSSIPSSAPSSTISSSSSSASFSGSDAGVSTLGIKIGLPIGIIVVVAALIAAFFFFRRYQKAQAAGEYDNDNDNTSTHEAYLLPKTGRNNNPFSYHRWSRSTPRESPELYGSSPVPPTSSINANGNMAMTTPATTSMATATSEKPRHPLTLSLTPFPPKPRSPIPNSNNNSNHSSPSHSATTSAPRSQNHDWKRAEALSETERNAERNVETYGGLIPTSPRSPPLPPPIYERHSPRPGSRPGSRPQSRHELYDNRWSRHETLQSGQKSRFELG